MKKLVLTLTTLTCSLHIIATETPLGKAQRRLHVINNHVFPQEHKATFNATAQTQPTVTCIDCQTGETQSWQTPTTSQLSHNTCAAQQQIDLTKLPQPSQTASYLAKIPKDAIEKELKVGTGMEYARALEKHAALIEKVALKEHKLHKTHYVFYHAMAKEMLFGLLLNTELARVFDNMNNPEWFKLRSNKDFYLEGLSIVDYLKKYRKTIMDHESPFRQNLLSVNFSFPGNRDFGESSFHYFLDNRSIADKDKIKGFITHFIAEYIPQEYSTFVEKHMLDFIEQLIKKINAMSNTGGLLQIFIPKGIVNECAFLCKIGAHPQDWRFSDASLSTWDQSLGCYTEIASVVNDYQNGCIKLQSSEIFSLQARLRLDNNTFNNPQSGIKIFLYHELPQQEFASLKQSIQELISEFISNKEVQLLLNVYHECRNNPTDLDALDNAITVTETAYKLGKQKLLRYTAPHKELINYCQKNIAQLHTKHLTKLQALITRYPQLSAMPLQLPLEALTNQNTVSQCFFSPNSLKIATLSDNKKNISIQNLNTGEKTHTLTYTSQVIDITFSPDASKIVIILEDKTIEIWDLIANKKIHALPFPDLLLEIIFNPDGSKIAMVSATSACLWDTITGKKTHTFSHNQNLRKKLPLNDREILIEKVIFSPDGSKIATVFFAETVIIWDAKTGKKISNWSCLEPIQDITCNTDGSKIAIAADDKTASMFDTKSGQKIHTFLYSSPVNSVVFSPDGKLLATTSCDAKAYIWDSTTKKHVILDHTDRVNTIRFNAEGSKVLTASDDKTACVWDTKTGSKLFTLRHPDKVYKARFNNDSSKVFTCFGSKETVLVWDIQHITLGNLLSKLKKS